MWVQKDGAFRLQDGPSANLMPPLFLGSAVWPRKEATGLRPHLRELRSRLKETNSILASARTISPSKSEGWTLQFMERETRYWVEALAGPKQEALFEHGVVTAWTWANPARLIPWFTDGERRYGQALWKLASLVSRRDPCPVQTALSVASGVRSPHEDLAGHKGSAASSRSTRNIPSLPSAPSVRCMPIIMKLKTAPCDQEPVPTDDGKICTPNA